MSIRISMSPAVQAVYDASATALAGLGGGWELLDGINQQQGLAARSLTVGGTWDPELNTLTTENAVLVQTTESGAARRVTETTSISCLLYASSGDLDFAVLRATANAALTAVRDQLRQVTAVDGLPAQARISEQRWAQVVDQAGAGAMALFTVEVRVLP